MKMLSCQAFGLLLLVPFLCAQDNAQQNITQQLRGLRNLPDDQRASVTRQLALDIRALPAGKAKVGLANSLANLSTEGDFGRDTLQEVASTLAQALRETPDQPEMVYSELAQLVRYEHVNASVEGPRMAAAMATLEAQDRDRRQAKFTLTDLHGKSWTLKELRGSVVLVNFWATWCPPCRKEMPDLDALYKRFQEKGLVILAISDEKEETVRKFLEAHAVSYPVLLDTSREVNKMFHVEGIPKTYIFDREGKLAAQAIDMRTKKQFLELLAQAGLE